MGDREYVSDLSVNEKTLMSVIRAAEGVKRAYSAIIRKYDLSFPQYNVLRVLESSSNGQNNITGVSKIMLVPYANMTGIAKRLEREGFLLRKSDPHDERVTILEITAKGRKSLKDIERAKDDIAESILRDFDQQEKLELLEKAKKLIQVANRNK